MLQLYLVGGVSSGLSGLLVSNLLGSGLLVGLSREKGIDEHKLGKHL